MIHDHPMVPKGTFAHIPQGIVHGPKKQVRDMFNMMRKPGDRRQMTAVSVDTYSPVKPSAELIEFHKNNPSLIS